MIFIREEVFYLDIRFKCPISCCEPTILKGKIYCISDHLNYVCIPEFLASIKNDAVVYFGIKRVIIWGKNSKLRIPKLNNICCVYVYYISIFLLKMHIHKYIHF